MVKGGGGGALWRLREVPAADFDKKDCACFWAANGCATALNEIERREGTMRRREQENIERMS